MASALRSFTGQFRSALFALIIALAICIDLARGAEQRISKTSPRNAYNMVLHKFGHKLYEGLNDTLRKHLGSVVRALVSRPVAALHAPNTLVYNQISGISDYQVK